MEANNYKLNYKDQKITLKGHFLEDIVAQTPTPFYLYDQQILEDNFQEFVDQAQHFGLNTMVCFALKANSNKKLLKVLAKKGAGADIVSGGELLRALSAGIPSQKIVFSGVGKTADEITLALKKNIYSFNVESLQELELINKLAKKMGKTANVAFRLNPKVHVKTHKHISTGFKTHKFGITCEDIIEAVKNPSYWSHTQLKGISIHIGSQLTCLKATQEAIINACECAKLLPTPLEFIDVGGGLGVTYNPESEIEAPSIKEYMELVATTIQNHYPSPIRVVFEPGRRIAATAGFFIVKVLRTKVSEGNHFIIVDGGMNDFVRPSLYEAYHQIYPSRITQPSSKQETFACDVVGPICETADCFGQKRQLPKLQEGDFLVICDTGAYGQTMSSNYNLRCRPAELLLTATGKLKMITKREKLKYLR